MSMTMAERIHASRCRTPRSKPSLVSAPKRARLDLVQILDQIQRPQPAAGLKRPAQLGHEHLVVVLTLDLARRPESDRARRYVGPSLDQQRECSARPG
jgi:hypothetical protein